MKREFELKGLKNTIWYMMDRETILKHIEERKVKVLRTMNGFNGVFLLELDIDLNQLDVDLIDNVLNTYYKKDKLVICDDTKLYSLEDEYYITSKSSLYLIVEGLLNELDYMNFITKIHTVRNTSETIDLIREFEIDIPVETLTIMEG